MANFLNSFHEYDGNGYTEFEAMQLSIDTVIGQAYDKHFQKLCSLERLKEIAHEMKKLSKQEKRCYFMHQYLFLSFSIISERLGIKKSTVQRYIERARKKLHV